MLSKTEIEYFIEIARAGQVSKAADRLGVTQPTLSHSIRRMEEALGLPLFVRSKKGVELTIAGRRLYLEAEDLRSAWGRVARAAHDEVERPQGLIRLGCHTAVAQYSLPLFLPKLAGEYPEIVFKLSHGLSRHLTEDVVSSVIDVALAVNPARHNDLVIKELGTDIVTLWRPHKCANEQLLLLVPELFQTQELLKKLFRIGISYRHHLESPSLEVIAQLLFAGVGHAILPQRVVESLGPKRASPVALAPSGKDRICLVYKPEFRKTMRGRVFVELASACFS
jgi:DNA-binding transcriptional LysR family regulator